MIMLTTNRALAALVAGLLWVAVSAEEDPHWNKATCQVCHLSAVPDVTNLGLRTEHVEELCATCHGSGGDARPCRHASDIPAANHAMPDSYRESLADGRLTCTTCHDMSFQCQNPSRSSSFVNPGFLRDRVSRDTSDQCFECHDASGYAKLDPHEGVAGDPLRPTCLLCHAALPESDQTGGVALSFNMAHDLNDACRGCHQVRPHPGNAFSGKPIGWEHLAAPSAEVLENIRASFEKTSVDLPLSPINGEVICSTCHNQHGFQAAESAAAGQELPQHRLRMNDICQACHDK